MKITHRDLAMRFNQVQDQALHIGWANYHLDVEYGASVDDIKYRIVNNLAKEDDFLLYTPFGEAFVTAGEMLHFINGYANALHDIKAYEMRERMNDLSTD